MSNNNSYESLNNDNESSGDDSVFTIRRKEKNSLRIRLNRVFSGGGGSKSPKSPLSSSSLVNSRASSPGGVPSSPVTPTAKSKRCSWQTAMIAVCKEHRLSSNGSSKSSATGKSSPGQSPTSPSQSDEGRCHGETNEVRGVSLSPTSWLPPPIVTLDSSATLLATKFIDGTGTAVIKRCASKLYGTRNQSRTISHNTQAHTNRVVNPSQRKQRKINQNEILTAAAAEGEKVGERLDYAFAGFGKSNDLEGFDRWRTTRFVGFPIHGITILPKSQFNGHVRVDASLSIGIDAPSNWLLEKRKL